MKLKEEFNPIYVQGAGRNVSFSEKDLADLLIGAVRSRADLVFKGEDVSVVYRPVRVVKDHERGALNIEL